MMYIIKSDGFSMAMLNNQRVYIYISLSEELEENHILIYIYTIYYIYVSMIIHVLIYIYTNDIST